MSCLQRTKVRLCSCSVVPDKQATAEAEVEAAAVRSAAAQLKTLLSETQAQQVILATTYDAWEDRLDSLKSPEDLIAALRDLEQELNGLGDGLPRGESLILASPKPCKRHCAMHVHQLERQHCNSHSHDCSPVVPGWYQADTFISYGY